MRALRRFTVRASLPDELMPLSQLVTNLRWSWHAETRDLFDTSRKYAQAVLEELDAQRVTRRLDDSRVLRSSQDNG